MKRICILGSTGSIGTQALDIIRNRKKDFKIIALSANKSADILYKQALEFKPEYVSIMDDDGYKFLKEKLAIYNIKVLKGIEGLNIISSLEKVDTVLVSVVGMIGLVPTISAIRAGKTIALANKETLVVGGEIIKNELEKSKSEILPVDSEHCAIFQCLKGENKNSIKKLILTASGGPFRGMNKESLKDITPEMAVNHPKWKMGKKISIDSATLMNKALEIIEAHFLYNVDYDNIDVVVHPQSIIHSMVEYIDGSIIAQMSSTDMRHPIQYVLDYPKRNPSQINYLNLFQNNVLTFEKPDKNTFKAIDLAYKVGKAGGNMPLVLNAANEEAVNLFINGKIRFTDISDIVEEAIYTNILIKNLTIENVLDIEKEVKEKIYKIYN